MECNKEEAVRAKEIAENKMQSNDFAVARKFALKAQQLYQDLENISQMITVCDVHCSAENKLFGNEMDWYGLLQIEETANEAIIRKQYRKFALQLHPDKNKFPGAETAFKLIGEAQRVLLDKDKRSLHDMKRKASVRRPAVPYQPPQRQQQQAQPGMSNSSPNFWTFTSLNLQHQRQQQQQAQPGVSNSGPTFWTTCPFCAVGYQYYRKVINKSILCQTCNKPFVAYERGEQSIPMAANLAQRAVHQQKNVPSPQKTAFPQKTGCSSEFGKEKVNGKRGKKQVVESSESCSTESSSDSEVDVAVDKNGDFQGGENFGRDTDQNRRRSSRHKQQVSYKENLSDDDDLVSHPKRFKGRGSSCATEKENGDALREEVTKSGSFDKEKSWFWSEGCSSMHQDEVKETCLGPEGPEGDRSHEDIEHQSDPPSSTPETIEIPDPEFFNFDEEKSVDKLQVGQIWSLYSDEDGLPKYYGQIVKIDSDPDFNLSLRWLESCLLPKNTIWWTDEDMPISCGRFKIRKGKSEEYTNTVSFSHLVSAEPATKKNEFTILPRNGEIWALYKNWNAGMKCSDLENCEYDICEIIKAHTLHIEVSVLERVAGFKSVYKPQKEASAVMMISLEEMLRFSHQIPAFKLTEERDGCLRGCWELDPAALPVHYFLL